MDYMIKCSEYIEMAKNRVKIFDFVEGERND